MAISSFICQNSSQLKVFPEDLMSKCHFKSECQRPTSPVAKLDKLSGSFNVTKVLLIILNDKRVKILLVTFILAYLLLHAANLIRDKVGL